MRTANSWAQGNSNEKQLRVAEVVIGNRLHREVYFHIRAFRLYSIEGWTIFLSFSSSLKLFSLSPFFSSSVIRRSHHLQPK